MISEGYEMHVYCDHAKHPRGEVGDYNEPAVFTGYNKRAVHMDRRRSGWIKVKEMDICPLCKHKQPIEFR